MSVEAATAALLIAVPICFNLAFFELGRTFDYRGILREPADVILRRFASAPAGRSPERSCRSPTSPGRSG